MDQDGEVIQPTAMGPNGWFCEFLDRFWTATTAAKVGSALVTKLENSEWRQNLRAEVAATEKKEMEKKGVSYMEEMTSKRLLVS